MEIIYSELMRMGGRRMEMRWGAGDDDDANGGWQRVPAGARRGRVRVGENHFDSLDV